MRLLAISILCWIGLHSMAYAGLTVGLEGDIILQCGDGMPDEERSGRIVTWHLCSAKEVRVLLKQVETFEFLKGEITTDWHAFEYREKDSTVDLANIGWISNQENEDVLTRAPFEQSRTLYGYLERLTTTIEELDEVPESKDALHLRDQLLGQAQKAATDASTLIKNYHLLDVKLADGRTVTCKRGGTAGCFFYHCPEVKVEDKVGSGVLFQDQDSARMLFLSPKGEVGSPVTVVGSSLQGNSSLFPGSRLLSYELGEIRLPAKRPNADDPSSIPQKWINFRKAKVDFDSIKTEWDSSGRKECSLGPLQKLMIDLTRSMGALEKEHSGLKFPKLISFQNSSLESKFMESSLLPDNVMQLNEDTYLLKEGEFELFRSKYWHLNTQVYSEDEAKKLFDEATKMADISFQYLKEGCAPRAHLVCDRLKIKEKVWIIPSKGSVPPYVDPSIKWNFHVAPTLRIRKGNSEIVQMVIDPSLSPTLLTVEEWVAKMDYPGDLRYGTWPDSSNPEVIRKRSKVETLIFFTPHWMTSLGLEDLDSLPKTLESARISNQGLLDKLGSK